MFVLPLQVFEEFKEKIRVENNTSELPKMEPKETDNNIWLYIFVVVFAIALIRR